MLLLDLPPPLRALGLRIAAAWCYRARRCQRLARLRLAFCCTIAPLRLGASTQPQPRVGVGSAAKPPRTRNCRPNSEASVLVPLAIGPLMMTGRAGPIRFDLRRP
jgi:hypothetical protein